MKSDKIPFIRAYLLVAIICLYIEYQDLIGTSFELRFANTLARWFIAFFILYVIDGIVKWQVSNIKGEEK